MISQPRPAFRQDSPIDTINHEINLPQQLGAGNSEEEDRNFQARTKLQPEGLVGIRSSPMA
jgi:hypothetical protein